MNESLLAPKFGLFASSKDIYTDFVYHYSLEVYNSDLQILQIYNLMILYTYFIEML